MIRHIILNAKTVWSLCIFYIESFVVYSKERKSTIQIDVYPFGYKTTQQFWKQKVLGKYNSLLALLLDLYKNKKAISQLIIPHSFSMITSYFANVFMYFKHNFLVPSKRMLYSVYIFCTAYFYLVYDIVNTI